MKTIKLVVMALLLSFTSCKEEKEATSELGLTFQHMAGDEVFEYDQLYQTAAGNEFSLKLWRTYISKITLYKRDGSLFEVPDSYYLIEPLNQGKYDLFVSGIPVAEYEKISFYIGVAGEANLKEQLLGDLDPSNNMAWNWTTGYKFIRMDGEFTDIAGNRRGVVVHIGTEENLKQIVFEFETPLAVGADGAHIDFTVDLLEAFKNPNTIDFEIENDFQFNEEANLIGENYAEGFIQLIKER